MRRVHFGRLLVGVLGMLGLTASMAQAQRPQLVHKQYDIEVTAASDIKVRIQNPPARFDQKGQLIPYSEKEKKELKGDSPEDKKLPGYKREFADLRTGDVVAIMLARSQPDPKNKDKAVWNKAGQLTGTIAGVQGAGKTLTVKINATEMKVPNLVPQVGAQNKVTLDPKQFHAVSVMVLVENTRDDTPSPGKTKSK